MTTTNTEGQRRLESPTDYVRLEISSALDRNIRIIPVLAEGVGMPHPQDLPEALVDLARRHAYEVHDNRWKEDVARLIEILEQKGAPNLQERPVVLREERVCFYSTPEDLSNLFGGIKWKFGKKLKANSKGPGTLRLTSQALKFVGSDSSFAVDLLDIITVQGSWFAATMADSIDDWLNMRQVKTTFDFEHPYLECVFYKGGKPHRQWSFGVRVGRSRMMILAKILKRPLKQKRPSACAMNE